MRRIFTAVALTAATIPLTFVFSSPASATLPTCYRTTGVDTGAIGPIQIPSAGTTVQSTNCIMQRGNVSAAVRRMQETLDRCYHESLTLDGAFGSLTQAALKRAQSTAGTTADGVYGPLTRDALKWWTGSICW